MKIIKIQHEDMSSEQQMAIKAIETLRERIQNKQEFSETDVIQIRSEIQTVHSKYKKAFKKKAYSWQVQRYTVQMALENEYKFCFTQASVMTWTELRWKFALINELAVYHYQCSERSEMSMEEHEFLIMCIWLFFQYFNVSPFNGIQCMKVIEIAFKIAKNVDDMVSECVAGIKRWRIVNDDKIKILNDQKTIWRQEVARLDRLLNGNMMLKEIERCHILHFFNSSLSFEENIRVVSGCLGVSEKGLKRKSYEYAITENSYRGMICVYRPNDEIEYKRQYRWAEKVKNNTLTKKERKEFWRKFSISNQHLMFRTFTFPEPDLISASDPLLTEECMPKLQELPVSLQCHFSSGIKAAIPPAIPPISDLNPLFT